MLNKFAPYFLKITETAWYFAIVLLLLVGWTSRDQRYLVAESGIGYWLGIIGGSLMLLLLVYPLRKRFRLWAAIGSVKAWFRIHMILGLSGPAMAVPGKNKIHAITVEENPQKTVISVTATTRPTFTVFRLSEPERLFVDIIDGDVANLEPHQRVRNGVVESISVEQRRETEQDLLKLYHRKLVENGVTDYSYKAMMQEYKLNLVVILFMFSMGLEDIDQTPERAQALFHQMYSRLDAALVDWEVVKILKVLPYLVPFLKMSVWFKRKFTRTTT